ncbi:ATP-dependent helicase [Gloeocapsa sp. PCC 73106]|uniref:ATP-dependent helicase n=1 Tax=Gloeocapsa sp. PCC 73106 TaxID=102232 RepID=UPI0002AC11B1|nr:ATP-dependent helicase [Gloeocapsa sp. PCC 73106]ELR96994.1 DNA/RNA helicase, superfamily I [Gloeocapsa sp. PCC 73106]
MYSSSSKQQQLIDNLRPGQKSLATWRNGKMAVAAVPGAGKSHSLSVAAALTIAREQLNPQRQLVIVTYTRSAAASIKQKVRNCLKELALPQWGFVVQTLHGLALSIATRHLELHHIDFETASIVTPNTNHQLIRNAVEEWIVQSPHLYQKLIQGNEFDGEETERLRRQSVLRTEVLPKLAYTAIREAKSSGLSPTELWELGENYPDKYEILAIASGLYQGYQRLMGDQNYIDYDDLILAALEVLENPSVRDLWQQQVYAVFEDEAQDSSPLQERLITLLAGANLVRVGDPNQAINSTFTPADPLYFNWFCQTCDQQQRLATMDQAGRSSSVIIKAANFALEWMNKNYAQTPIDGLNLPFRPQQILPVTAGDPQPDANPTTEGSGVEIYFPEDIYESVTLIKARVIKLLTQYPHRNAAILVRENRQGSFLAQQLKQLPSEQGIKVYEVAETQRHSEIPREILKLLSFLDRPHSPDRLKDALEILQERQLISNQDLNALATYPEQFLYPTPLTPPQSPSTLAARRYCCSLLKAKLELPHYQLIAFLSMTLKYTGSELATVQKLSETINQKIRGRNSLKNAIATLEEIVSSENFEAVGEDNEDQYTRPGQVTIITMHKAKGLDWDYVFIPFLHQDTLPGELRVPTNAKFLGDFTLGEVARVQIRNYLHAQHQGHPLNLLHPLEAWSEAKKLKKAEEFRLLYVAMTRAKRLLWLTAAQLAPFNWTSFSPENPNLQKKQPFALLKELQTLIFSK